MIGGSGSETDGMKRTLTSGRTVLTLPVNGEHGSRLGLLVVVFSRNAGKSSSFNPKMITNILAPALELIGEGLIVSQQLHAGTERIRRHRE